MQILISCAKDMSTKEEVMDTYGITSEEMACWPATHPSFGREAAETALEMSAMSAESIGKLLKCNEVLASLNKARFSRFNDDSAGNLSMQAAVTYSGVAFRHLKAATMTFEEKLYANSHLWIASFMYGLLRPMDRMLPYRMEGNVKLKVHGGKSLFDWWKPLLTDFLICSVQKDDGRLLWCSTDEMKRLVDWNRLLQEIEVVEPVFLVRKGNVTKTMSVYSKMCRGAMAAAVIANPEMELKDFNYEGFHLVSEQKGEEAAGMYSMLTFRAEK